MLMVVEISLCKVIWGAVVYLVIGSFRDVFDHVYG